MNAPLPGHVSSDTLDLGVSLVRVVVEGTVIALVLFGLLLLYPTFKRSLRQLHRPRAISRTSLEGGGTELELADGSRWRTEVGYVWHHFPGGHRAELEFEFYLDAEDDRMRLIGKWSETTP